MHWPAGSPGAPALRQLQVPAAADWPAHQLGVQVETLQLVLAAALRALAAALLALAAPLRCLVPQPLGEGAGADPRVVVGAAAHQMQAAAHPVAVPAAVQEHPVQWPPLLPHATRPAALAQLQAAAPAAAPPPLLLQALPLPVMPETVLAQLLSAPLLAMTRLTPQLLQQGH